MRTVVGGQPRLQSETLSIEVAVIVVADKKNKRGGEGAMVLWA